jgi:large subunit ribosomal protein L24e
MDCNFCSRKIPKGSEVIFVTKKGKALYFCSSKCENNMVKLKRKPRKVKWTVEYRKEKEVRLKLLAQSKTEEPEAGKTMEKEGGEEKENPEAGEAEKKTKKKIRKRGKIQEKGVEKKTIKST